MRNFLRVLGLTTLGLLLLAVPSRAATIQFVDTYTPTGSPVAFPNNTSFDYSHDITLPVSSNNSLQTFIDGALTPGAGYDSSIDSLTSGSVTFFFNVSGGGAKNYTLFLGGDPDNLGGGLSVGSPTQIVIGTATFDVSWITSGGLLSVDLTRSNNAGTVSFIKSVLDVSGTRETVQEDLAATPVPEPASLMLLSVGLVSLASKLRGKRKTTNRSHI